MNLYFIRHAEPDYDHDTITEKRKEHCHCMPRRGVISALISHLANIPFFHFISHMGSDLMAVSKFELRGNKDEYHPAQMIYLNSQAHLGIK